MLAARPASQSSVAPIVEREQLRPLTSLRFVAAAMVVLLHSRVMFPFSATWGDPLNLSEGVTFFFILSGFILTYAYPKLDEVGTRRFLVARIARIWPAHAATMILMLIPVAAGIWDRPPNHILTSAIATLAMIHAWVPNPTSYFTFNTPAWSISAEFAFYLVFPFLLRDWRRTWAVKLLAGLMLLVGLNRLSSDVLALPVSSDDWTTPISSSLVGVFPLATLYQFMIGMGACLVWRALASRVQLGMSVATLLELGAIGAAGWCLAARPTLPAVAASLGPWLGWAWFPWVPPVPFSVLAYAILIVMFALGQGLVSRLLALGPFVLLGEISYSVYLIHFPMILAYNYLGRPIFGGWADPVEYAIFWLGVLAASSLIWWGVELPARRAIRGWYARHEHALTGRQWRMVGVGIAAVLLAVLAVHVATLR